ncbi:laminin subunit gamma-1-like [Clytia hemisphaerica]|uniref:Uncharacterized protein n=1 Tax=Clytia hemisphaerica TaxID=252671 RepID=A0A7M6DQ26_9CNID
MRLLILLSFVLNYVWTQDFANNDEYQFGRAIKCKRDDGIGQRCMPVFENVAYNRIVVANNTCGTYGKPEEYCVQTGVSGATKICETCYEKVPGQNHPADLMTDIKIDGNPTWWQSQTLLDNRYGVHLILDFKKKYNIAFIRIRFHTIRPHSFAIHKKSTYSPSERWLPYQFYSRTCNDTYGLPNKGIVTLANQNIALCTDRYSGMIPLSGGNVAYLTLDHRPGKNNFDRYPSLQEWVTVTQLKISLDQLNTFGDEVFGDPKVLKSYYFAISDIAVGGRCKCNGHASTCARNQNTARYYCECDHNTAGVDCEKCLPLYNDRPWRRASGRFANPCKKCDCNGLADTCVFDEQLWIDSNYRSGGRCVNCQKNTDGVNCERCKQYHYRKTSSESCTPCNCNQDGSRSASCNNDGRCSCKPGVTGDKCDRCISGYYGFSSTGCQPCYCDKEGALSNTCDATGQCKCKENVMGKRCDQCKPNHFDLDTTNAKGCKACFCNGHGVSCTHAQGIQSKLISSTFDTDLNGWRLEDQYGNDYTNLLRRQQGTQHITSEAVGSKTLYMVAPSRYLGDKLSSYAKNFAFTYGIYREPEDPEIVTSREDIIFEGAGMTATYEITSQNNERPKGRFVKFNYKLVEPSGMTTFNFQKLLSDLTAIKIRTTFLKNRRFAIDDVNMESTQYVSLNSLDQVTWKEKCQCQVGYAGEQCEKCQPGFTRENVGSGPLGRCVPCECNNHGTRCDPETGICECQDNTSGRNCELCKKGYYGNPTRGTKDDCQPCPCIFANECILIGQSVKCTDCPEGHIGDNCEKCADGYFGDPEGKLGTPTKCQRCDCNGNVDPNAIGNCDGLTGACLKCIYNTTNGDEEKCEECADGFYGDALAEPKGNCTACKCFEPGTKKPAGHVAGEAISCDKNGKCECLDNVKGDHCDQCPAGHWNVQSGNGCEKCNCHPDGSIGEDCDIETGQCKCRPGVAGRTCNQCAPGHFEFSADGCKACNCHPDGSVHQNCTSDGVCVCKPGVLGIKCDQCPENKYNLSVGCIACPKCFDLVQLAVNKLRQRLSTMNLTKGNFTNEEVGIDVRDENFENAIRALDKAIDELKKKTNSLLDGDKQLFEFFDGLRKQFEKINERFGELKSMVEQSKEASEKGEVEVTRAEEIIEEIKKLLQDAEDKIAQESAKLFDKNDDSAVDLSDLAKEMREIAKEARKLATKHEKEAGEIQSTTDMALNQSTNAYNTAKMARDMEEKINKELKENVVDVDEAMKLAEESRKLINDSVAESNAAIADGKKLIDEAMEELPDFKAKEMKESADEKAKSASEVSEKSDQLLKENKEAIEQLKKDDTEARRLMKEGRELKTDSNDLYAKAKNASDEAMQAQEDGKRVANEAKEMLKTLMEFEETIAKSKANATEAMKLIPLIKKLIKEANEVANVADKKVSGAEGDAEESHNTASNAHNVTMAAKNDIDDLIAQAKKLLNETMSFMMNEVVETQNNIKETDKKLDEYKEIAIEDGKKVDKASDDSKMAAEVASKANNDLTKSLEDVDKLIETIENLDEINLAELEEAERRFAAAQDQIDGAISFEINSLQNKLKSQNATITEYELDLDPLRAQVDFVHQLYQYLPKTCFRSPEGLEGNQNAKK